MRHTLMHFAVIYKTELSSLCLYGMYSELESPGMVKPLHIINRFGDMNAISE